MRKDRILVVDPDFDIRNMLQIYFTGLGYEVTTAENGATATATLSSENVPDVVVVEESLPDMDGRALVQALWQKVYMDPRPPVIYMEKNRRPDRIGSGFFDYDDYVTKPFDIEELKLRIEYAIRQSKRNDSASG